MDNPKLADRADQRLYAVSSSGQKTGRVVDRRTAHTSPGVKHMAVGILVFSGGKLVLHKRLGTKVGGDTIDYPVSHVLEGETPEEASWRCLVDEYGIKERIPLTRLCAFPYDHTYEDGTCENEYLIVFQADYSGKISPNPKEMEEELVVMAPEELAEDIQASPDKYAVWLRHTMQHMPT